MTILHARYQGQTTVFPEAHDLSGVVIGAGGGNRTPGLRVTK